MVVLPRTNRTQQRRCAGLETEPDPPLAARNHRRLQGRNARTSTRGPTCPPHTAQAAGPVTCGARSHGPHVKGTSVTSGGVSLSNSLRHATTPTASASAAPCRWQPAESQPPSRPRRAPRPRLLTAPHRAAPPARSFGERHPSRRSQCRRTRSTRPCRSARRRPRRRRLTPRTPSSRRRDPARPARPLARSGSVSP
jgi:hypothetical protein